MKKQLLTYSILLLVGTLPVIAARLQTDLNNRLKGQWLIISRDVTSGCDGGYTNNKVNDTRVLGSGHYTLPTGELAQIKSIDLKRSRVDVHISLATPFRTTWEDGPFRLYDHRTCSVELQVNLPRELVKKKKIDEIIQYIYKVVEPFPSREAAMGSSGYNGRETEPFPSDYSETLAQYEAWKAEQRNRLIHEERQKSLELANDILIAVGASPEYAKGFAKGIRDLKRNQSEGCDSLLNGNFYPKKLSDADRYTPNFKDGYSDGQKLAYHLNRAERLIRCLQ